MVDIIAFLLIIVFLYAGASKLEDYTLFRLVIADSPILKPFAFWLAWMVPAAELVTALLLLFPTTRLSGLHATLGLMIVFFGYIVGILALDKQPPCSCGGILELFPWKTHLIFDGILILLAQWGVRLQRESGSHVQQARHRNRRYSYK